MAHRLPSSIIGCVALPLGLHILNSRLSTTNSTSRVGGSDTSHPHVERISPMMILIETLKASHSRYDGVEWVSTAINYFMECTHWDREMPSRSSASSASSPLGDTSIIPFSMENASDFPHFVFQPALSARNLTHYLRLVTTLDLSLNLDRLPQEADFPLNLRSVSSSNGCFVPALFGASRNKAIEDGSDPQDEGIGGILDIMSPVPPMASIQGWVENDRSLYFAQEMGLIASEINDRSWP